jgi:1-acyl-sn-glycerol-3-phosphate acyltransferase
MRLLRSGLFSLWFFGVSFVLVVWGMCLRPDRLPAHGIVWSRMVLKGLPICGIRIEITGREHLPKGGAMLIASMHQSAFDTLIWLQLLPFARYIVKAELLRIPMFGILAVRSGQIGVDRDGGANTMRQLIRDGGAALDAGGQVVIFPEGTRAGVGELVELQPGVAALATRAQLGVIPVLTDSGLCWGKGPWGKRPGVIHIHIQPPLPAGLRRPELMRRLGEIFAAEVSTQRLALVDNSVH